MKNKAGFFLMVFAFPLIALSVLASLVFLMDYFALANDISVRGGILLAFLIPALVASLFLAIGQFFATKKFLRDQEPLEYLKFQGIFFFVFFTIIIATTFIFTGMRIMLPVIALLLPYCISVAFSYKSKTTINR